MFQRIRGAIDRTIAEEQARQKVSDNTGLARSGSTSSRRTPRPKNSSVDPGDSAPNPDPAVFEAAFVIDDSDEPSRAATPKPMAPDDKDAPYGESTAGKAETGEKAGESGDAKEEWSRDSSTLGGDTVTGQGNKSAPASVSTASALTPEIRQRLRKLEKLESTYPELLRSYRVAHRRATAIEPFERALRENTPLTSISDPDALTEYLNQLKLRGDMVMDELKRVSADKDELKKKNAEGEEKLKKLQEQVDVLKAAKPTETTPTDDKKPKDAQDSDKAEKADGAAKESEAGVDFFSYDDEIPQLQADVAAKAEEIEKLKSEVDGLKQELSAVKENSAGLAEGLEKSSRELSESRDATASQAALQTELDARDEEISIMTERLETSQTQLTELEAKLEEEQRAGLAKFKDIEASLAAFDKRATDLDAELAQATSAKAVSKKLIDDLTTDIEALKKEKSDNRTKIEELTKKLQSQPQIPTAASTATSSPQPVKATPAATGGGSKRKNNKKKKGKGGAAASASAPGLHAEPIEAAEKVPACSVEGPDNAALESEISRLKEEIVDKDKEIERLSKKRKSEEDLREEIETLQENLINIGQDHVEYKEKFKAQSQEQAEYKVQITTLEAKLASSSSDTEANTKLQAEIQALQKDYEDMKDKSATLQSDLGAAQQLAQSRFKDLTELREVLQKAQPELKSLRQDSAALKTTREELAAKTKELKEMEKKEKDLKRDLARAQQMTSDRETEVKGLHEKLTTEGNARARLEDAQRVSGRDLRRTEAEKIELSAKAEKAERELQRVQTELNKLRPHVKELEEQMHKLKREKTAAQEEVDFKTQQYTNAQRLLSSMREQAAEMTVQLKEAQSQAESLEEELAEVQRLLQERTREGETMRRLLADVDERADSKVREMRARMEVAIEERERIEDESSTLARRKARETEELKSKIRELEREVKTLGHERDELEQREKDWRRRREELEAVESKVEAETEEMRGTISQLRTALDASERQVREGEKQRADLRKMLDDSRLRYERVAKDLKTAQSKLTVTVASSSRSSMDSTRSGLNGGGSAASLPDTMYLKTILLQFLEQKDSKLRAQLVPVLGKLLKFDRADEKKWLAAVQHIEVR